MYLLTPVVFHSIHVYFNYVGGVYQPEAKFNFIILGGVHQPEPKSNFIILGGYISSCPILLQLFQTWGGYISQNYNPTLLFWGGYISQNYNPTLSFWGGYISQNYNPTLSFWGGTSARTEIQLFILGGGGVNQPEPKSNFIILGGGYIRSSLLLASTFPILEGGYVCR